MNRESFLETVRQHYSEEIHSAFVSCEHGKDVDYPKLSHLLTKLRDAAKCEGLSYWDFDELVKSALPEAWDHLPWKKAA